MLSRPHPTHPYGAYLYLQPGDWRETLQRQIDERDRLDDLNHTGPAPAFEEWVHQQQIPALAQQQHYRPQFEARLDHLHFRLSNLQAEINAGRLDLQPQADEMQAEINHLQELLNG